MGNPFKINRELIQKTWEFHSKSAGDQTTWEVHWESIQSLFRIHSKSVGNPKSMGNPFKAHKIFIQTHFEIVEGPPLKSSGYTCKINWKCMQNPSEIHAKYLQHPFGIHSTSDQNQFKMHGKTIQS